MSCPYVLRGHAANLSYGDSPLPYQISVLPESLESGKRRNPMKDLAHSLWCRNIGSFTSASWVALN